MARLSTHLRSNVVAYLALLVALGGTSYAATQLPKNSVGTKQLKAQAVTSAKLEPGAVTRAKLKPSAVTGPQVGDGSLTGTELSDDSVTGADVDESTLGQIGAGVMTGRIEDLASGIVNGGPPVGTSVGTSAGISTYQTLSPSVPLVARDFSFRLSAAPGMGKSRSMQFVVGALSTVVCVIEDLASTCTAPGPLPLLAATGFSIQSIPTGSPAVADVSFGYRLVTP